jgi:hypothetical protein
LNPHQPAARLVYQPAAPAAFGDDGDTLGGILDTGGPAQFGTAGSARSHYELHAMVDQPLIADGDPSTGTVMCSWRDRPR